MSTNLPTTQNNSLPTTQNIPAGLNSFKQSNSNFIPTLKIVYKNSQEFDNILFKEGDFSLSGSSLGKSVNVIYFDSQIKVVAKEKATKKYLSSIYFDKNEEWQNTERYSKFLADNIDNEIDTGIANLIYIPKHNSFCEFYAKGKVLPRTCLKLLEFPNELVTMTSRKEPGNKVKSTKSGLTFFDIDLLPTGQKYTITLDEKTKDLWDKNLTDIVIPDDRG